MEPRTSRKDYVNHQYSGSRKNLKRIRGQIKRYYGESKSRSEVWCKKKTAATPSVPSSPVVEKAVKTYSRKKRNGQTEAKYKQNEEEKSEQEPSILQPMDIEFVNSSDPTIICPNSTVDSPNPSANSNYPTVNSPNPSVNSPNPSVNSTDPTVDSPDLTDEIVPPNNLHGLLGNRIVDLAHVLQWAFKLERHRSKCKGSSIIYINEVRNGFHSVFNFKCSICQKELRYSNVNGEKLNKAFIWGTLTAGSSYTQAAHITNLMDIPTMAATKFQQAEKLLGDVWKDHMCEELTKNGQQASTKEKKSKKTCKCSRKRKLDEGV